MNIKNANKIKIFWHIFRQVILFVYPVDFHHIIRVPLLISIILFVYPVDFHHIIRVPLLISIILFVYPVDFHHIIRVPCWFPSYYSCTPVDFHHSIRVPCWFPLYYSCTPVDFHHIIRVPLLIFIWSWQRAKFNTSLHLPLLLKVNPLIGSRINLPQSSPKDNHLPEGRLRSFGRASSTLMLAAVVPPKTRRREGFWSHVNFMSFFMAIQISCFVEFEYNSPDWFVTIFIGNSFEHDTQERVGAS